MIITLKCCTCGKEIGLQVNRAPSFGFEIYQVAKDVGWNPVIDLNWNRTLVFCSKDCEKVQVKKNGAIRKNLIRKVGT